MKTTKPLFAVASLLVSMQIQAAPGCTAANLNGNYVMFQNTLTVPPTPPHTGSCKVTVLNGVLAGNCAFTLSVNGIITPGFNGPVSGTASISPDCSAAMQINFTANGNPVQSFFNLQFTPDKQSFIGQWTNSGGLLGTSSGTRYVPAP